MTTIGRQCTACGIDADALRGNTERLRRLLAEVDKAFDPTVPMAWETRLAARQKALEAVKAEVHQRVTGGAA